MVFTPLEHRTEAVKIELKPALSAALRSAMDRFFTEN
jgi:hypothetical protein